DVVDEVRAIADGGVEHAFEVVGSAVTMRQAWDVLRPGGTATVVGLAPVGVEVSLPAIEFLSEKTITGSYYGSTDVHAALGRLVQLVVDGRLDLENVVQYLISLDDLEAALERLRRGHGARSVIIIDEQLAGGAAQLGIAQGVLDAVADGLLEPTDDVLVFVCVWVDPDASDATAIRAANREATRKAIGVCVEGRDPEAARALVARRDEVTSAFY